MPAPSSVTVNRTSSPSRRAASSTRPPRQACRTALAVRFCTTCSRRTSSPGTDLGPGIDANGERDPGGLGVGSMPLLGPREQIADRDRGDLERGSAGIEPGQVEQIVDDPLEPLRLDADHVHGLLARRRRRREVGQGQRLGVAADRGQRRAQLVRHVGQQLAPGPIGLDEGGFAGRRLHRPCG